MNRKSRILTKVLCFTLAIMLFFTMIPIDKVYAKDVGIGTDGYEVDLSLWNYSIYRENCSLDSYEGSFVNGEIVGSVPATINGKPVTSMFLTFSGCRELKKAPEIPDSVIDMSETFYECSNLTEAPEIPNGVTQIASAFYNCTGLTEAPEIPSSVYDIRNAFEGCTGLTKAPEIPSGVTDMLNVFKGCTGLKEAPAIPSSVTEMSGTFEGCTGLTQAPQIPNGVSNMSYTFNNCIVLTTPPVLPKNLTNMEYAFSGCKALKSAPNIPDGVTNIKYAFNGCTTLVQAPLLPSSVKTINHAFTGCTALTQLPIIPNGVTDMSAAFAKCTKLAKTPQIPESVIDMSYAFYMCKELTQIPVIPDVTKNMSYAFSGCTKLTGNIFIPNSVNKMLDIFTDTTMPITMIYSSNNSATISVVVPSNVTKVVDSASPEILSIFDGGDGDITVKATDDYCINKFAITTSSTAPTEGWQPSNIFSNMSNGKYYAWAMDKVGNVSIRKAFVFPQAVGVDTDGNEVDMLLWDYTDSGETCSVNKYTGSIVYGKIIGSVPATINGKPVTAMPNTFKDCTALIQAPQIPSSVTSMSYTFSGCIGLAQVPEIPSSVTNVEYAFSDCKSLKQAPRLPNGITNMRYTFNNCTALTQSPEIPSSVTDMRYTFNGCKALEQAPVLPSTVTTINHAFSGCTALTQAPEIPDGVTDMNAAFSKCTNLTQTTQIPESVIDMSYAFYMCTGLTSIPEVPNGVKNMDYTFYGCTSLTGEIYIPNSVIRMSNIFTNTLLPITVIYSSDNIIASSYTSPSNVTKAVNSGTIGIFSVTELDGTITVNVTDNYSVDKYAITTSTTAPAEGWQSSNIFLNMPNGKYYAWAMDQMGNVSAFKAFMFPQAVAVGTDGNEVDLLLWDFSDNGDTYNLDRYVGSIVDGKIIGSVPATINGKPVTAMSNTFKDCTTLKQAPEISSSVTNMEYAFSGCKGLVQAPQIPNGVTNMSYTFNNCTALIQAPDIPSSITNMEYAFSGCQGLVQAPQLPEGVTNMRYTFNNCSALVQPPMLPSSVTTINHTFSGCTALTQAPEIPNSVTDMNAAFSKCTKLTQPPQIPNSVIDMQYAFYMCTGLTSMPVIPNGIKDMNYTFYGCTNLTGEIFIPNSVIRMSNIFTNTSMPITMIYSSDNKIASSHIAPSNVKKVRKTHDIAISINDIILDEGAGLAAFTVSLSEIYSSDIEIYYYTADNTANAGDYISASGVATIPAGSTTVEISVPIIDDYEYEPIDSFYLKLIEPSEGYLKDSQGECKIKDNDSMPLIGMSVDDDNSFIGNGQTRTISFFLSNESYLDVTINLDYSGTAINGIDYTTSDSTLVIPAGSYSGEIEITAMDTGKTYDRTVIVSIVGVKNGTENGTQQETLTIRENGQISYLSNLSISSGTLDPIFSSSNFHYNTQNVGYDTESVTVTSYTSILGCTITVDGNPATSGQPSSVDLNVGSNTINIVVTNGVASQMYTITVVRASSPYLSSVTGIPGITFVKTTYTYEVNTTLSKLKVTGVPEDTNATMTLTLNGVEIPYKPFSKFHLNSGENVLIITSTSKDGEDSRTYTFNINKV